MFPRGHGPARRGLAAVARVLVRVMRALAPAPGPPGEDLVVCATCGARFVHPVVWEPADESSWWMRIRCGACEVSRAIVVSNAKAAGFDRALNRQMATIERAVAELDRERMADEVNAFVAALRDGRIDASAFAG